MTIDEIKEMLRLGLVPQANDRIVQTGVLKRHDGREVDYQLHHGWDIAKAHACDTHWGRFNLSLMQYLADLKLAPDDLKAKLAQIQIDDSHWRWFNKSVAYSDDQYDWFYLMTGAIPQGACLIYHPKPSELEAGDIFYIEYIAAAPWNRKNPMTIQEFNGVGRTLIRYATNFGRNTLGLRYGFSLHALQRAAGFYTSIGMEPYVPADKPNLPYFEMREAVASAFAGGV